MRAFRLSRVHSHQGRDRAAQEIQEIEIEGSAALAAIGVGDPIYSLTPTVV